MLKKIMVPLDGSAFAEAALRTGIGLARRDQAELSLLTVVPPPVPPVYLEGAVGVATELHERAASVAAEYVRSVTERVRGEAPGLEIHGLTVLGGVVDSIDHAAREGATDLIVMSSHGRGPFQRMWLGSVADGVLRHGPAPVLLVRPAGDSAADSGGPVEFPTVLIPIDASPAARGIIPDAVDVAGAAARYRVVRVSVPRSGPRPGHLPDSRDEVPDPEADRIRAEELLDQAVEELRALGATDVQRELLVGDHVASLIIEQAAETGASLVAMATHGDGGVVRLLLGSTADKVARGVHCPVLLHRTP